MVVSPCVSAGKAQLRHLSAPRPRVLTAQRGQTVNCIWQDTLNEGGPLWPMKKTICPRSQG